MNLFKKRNQEPSDSDGILGKGILHLDALISDLTAQQAEQEKEITRLQRLVTQHDQYLDHYLKSSAIYVNGEVHARFSSSIEDRYDIETISYDKENDLQTVKLTPKHIKLLSEEKTNAESGSSNRISRC